MSDVTNTPVESGQGVSAPVEAGQAVQSEPFYTYKGATGEEVYKSREELDKAMRESFLRQSDYTRKTQEVAKYRKQFDEDRKKFDEDRKTFSQSRSKYDEWDKLLKSRPDIYSQLERLAGSPPDAGVAFDRSKEYADEKTRELAERIEAMEAQYNEEKNRREMDEVFGRMKEEYPDFDQTSVLEMLETLKDGQTEPLIRALYLANKGRANPVEAEKKVVEKLQKKAEAGLVPGKSAAPKGDTLPNSIQERAQAALRAVGARGG